MKKRKKLSSINEALEPVGAPLSAGDYAIAELQDGTFWLENADGEGCQVDADQVEYKLECLFEETF